LNFVDFTAVFILPNRSLSLGVTLVE